MRRLRRIGKIPFVYATLLLARLMRFSFPDRFPWYRILDYLFDRYEIETTRFFKQRVRRGMTVVDIGASIGYFTRLFSRLVGPSGAVYAFEPDDENFEILKRNTAHLKNVHLFKMAIADVRGTATFYHVPHNSSLHSLIPTVGATTHEVSQTTLDLFAAEHHIVPDVVKIDVEGAEARVFAGMQHVMADACIVFEYIPRSSKELVDSLQSSREIFSINENGRLQPFANAAYRTGKDEYTNLVLLPAAERPAQSPLPIAAQ